MEVDLHHITESVDGTHSCINALKSEMEDD